MRIGFVTCAKLHDLTAEDRLVADALRARGVEVEPLAWDAENRPYRDFRALVIRSPWNYSNDHPAFLRWMDRVEASKVPVWNPLELIHWNFNKHYLQELSAKGATVAPTIYVSAGQFAGFTSGKLVAKPVVSAGARNTIVSESDLMIQPFMDEIQTEGEWSFLFFGGEFSHAVLKKPAKGDFRVQEKFQGTWDYVKPSQALTDQATAITRLIPHEWLYARVDGVRRGDRLWLMELEVFEPQLFLKDRSDLAEKVAANILKRI